MKKKTKKKLEIVLSTLCVIDVCAIVMLATPRNIVYGTNGGTFETKPVTKFYPGKAVTPSTPVREYSTFTGWTDEDGKPVKKIFHKFKDQKLMANYEGNEYMATFMDDGKVIEIKNYKYGEEFKTPKVNKEHETFDGWMINGAVTNEPWNVGGDIIAYAHYTVKRYNIAYDTDGGALSGEYPVSYAYGESIDLPTPVKDGYGFTGWYDEENILITNANFENGISGDLKLKAGWRELAKPVGVSLSDSELVKQELAVLALAVPQNETSEQNISDQAESTQSILQITTPITNVSSPAAASVPSDIDRIYVGSYWANIRYDNSQATVDAPNTAACFWLDGHLVIGDHNYQKFWETERNDVLTWAKDGAETKYHAVSRYMGRNTGFDLVLADGRSLGDVSDGNLVTYTCEKNNTVAITFWQS